MKRITIIFIVGVIILSALTACNGKGNSVEVLPTEETKESQVYIEETNNITETENATETPTEEVTETPTDRVIMDHTEPITTEWWWEGETISPKNPKVEGPCGTETYFNEDIDKIVEDMQRQGFIGEYWITEDGVKMLGEYILCKSSIRNFGCVFPTSTGVAIVCDTNTDEEIAIAVTW